MSDPWYVEPIGDVAQQVEVTRLQWWRDRPWGEIEMTAKQALSPELFAEWYRHPRVMAYCRNTLRRA